MLNAKSVDIAQNAKQTAHSIMNNTITMVLLQGMAGDRTCLDPSFDHVVVNIVPMRVRCLLRNDGF
jgi:hypothetical protein